MEIVRNLVSVGDMTRTWWDELYSRCRDILARPGDYIDSCRGKVTANLFFEPSTRTNYSFQSAMMRLGGNTFGFSDPMSTSVSKGETLADTIRIAASYADTIIVRSPLEGAAAAAALYSPVPLINAGDGGHYHPTQTLADLTTIAQRRGGIENIRVGLCGDLKYGRTVHSLIEALSMFSGISFCLISPPELQIPDYMREQMRSCNQQYTESESLADSVSGLDILYMTRVQRERFRDKQEYERLKDVYTLTRKLLSTAPRDLLVMHPLPRTNEIAYDVDSDPRAAYFEQARCGMFIRMALLLEFCHKPRIAPPPVEYCGSGHLCHNPVCVTSTEQYLPPLGISEGRCGYCDKGLDVF